MENIEKKLDSHLLWIYTNDDSYIEPSMLEQIYKHINKMNIYNKLSIVINTKGGNLATGYKIVKMLQDKFQDINTIVVERCNSTGTLIMLSSSQIYLSPFAVVTPTEPQMNAYDYGNISVNVIRNYLNKINDNKLDPIIYGTYLSTIEYFKKICYNLFEEDKANLIINFMLNEINSHEYPLSKKELEKMLLKVDSIPLELQNYIYELHNKIKRYLTDKHCYENRKVVIMSNGLTTVYCKKYAEDKRKLDEGYIDLEGDGFMEKKTIEKKGNGRILDILNEDIQPINQSYKDAYNDRHWDSYTDSLYHDYGDASVYRDYGDNSTYHDSYKDAAQIDPMPVLKTNSRILDILNEDIQPINQSYKDAYNDRHWDSYTDSLYHDYGDASVYRDYGDNSTYHDSYKDAAVDYDKSKVLKKK